MKDLEKAKAYSEGKIIEALTATIEKAYLDGYQTGYNEALAATKTPSTVNERMSYVDLDLPNKTLWATDYLRGNDGKIIYCTYDEAAPLSIPSESDYESLMRNCTISLIAPDDSTKTEKMYKISSGDNYLALSSEKGFWLKPDHISYFDQDNMPCVKSLHRTKSDKNERLPVILVKEKVKSGNAL